MVASAEEWRQRAATAIVALLEAEGAATQRGMEAKLADTKFAGQSSPINPHHLTTARQRLIDAGTIEQSRDRTRGGAVVPVFTLASPSKAAIRAAGRKRLLHARFLGWSKEKTEWGAAPVPAALERVIHASLTEAAPHGYRLLRPDGSGEVRTIANQRVPGGPLDNAAFYTGFGADGLPAQPALITVEAKNLRQWIYPNSDEPYQLLDKSARLRAAHPGLPIMPVFVCRKSHHSLGKMAGQLGFHLIYTANQYVRPAVAGTEDDERKFNEVNTELAYRLALNEGAVPQMVKQFTTAIPGRIEEATARWAQFCSHPEVPDLLRALRDPKLTYHVRHMLLNKLGDAAADVFTEPVPWRPEASHAGDDE